MTPLDDIRVLDFGQYLAGPFGPMVLADLGADVIKVEPVSGDGMRPAGKAFFGCQRGKRSVALDLKDRRGLELALELVKTADVVHHNMTLGTASRLGIDYAACRAVRPDVIYAANYAYGAEGPLAHFGGLDPLFQASSGLEYEAGATSEGNDPLYYRFGMCDTGNAMLSVVGVLLALHHRDRTGEGQELWTSLLDAGALFSSDALVVDGKPIDRPRLDAGLHGFDAGYRLYETSDDWIQVAAVGDGPRRSLRAVVGVQSDDQLDDAFRSRPSLAWHEALDAAGVPNEVPLDPEGGSRVLNDSTNVSLGLVASFQHPTMGAMRQYGSVVGFSASDPPELGPPPLVGEHTRSVLDELGVEQADQDALRASGVVAWPDEDYAQRYGQW